MVIREYAGLKITNQTERRPSVTIDVPLVYIDI